MQFVDEEAPIVNPVDVGLSSKLIVSKQGQNQDRNSVSKQEKFSEFLKTEKLRKYKRMPRVFNQRSPIDMKCPSCGKERESRTRLETTGSQWCTCILCCWMGCYLTCCIPFCFKRCYNVRHSCHECYYMIGESGV